MPLYNTRMIWGLAALVLLLSLASLTLGLRGRRIGDTPHCRGCDFDLSGLDTGRCPECGRSLEQPGGIARGTWRRRPIAIALALVLGLAGLGIGAFAITASNASWNTYKPISLLMFEATRLHGAAGDAAAVELLKRHTTTPLSNDQLQALVQPALAAQADPTVVWEQSPWWRLLDHAFLAGLPAPEQQVRYLRTAVGALRWTLPDTALAEHDWLPQPSQWSPQSIGPMRLVPAAPVQTITELLGVEVDSQPVELLIPDSKWQWRTYRRACRVQPDPVGNIHPVDGSGTMHGQVRTDEPTPAFPTLTLDLGPHRIDASWRIGAFLVSPSPPGWSNWGGPPPDPPDVTWEFQLQHDLTASTVESLITLVDDTMPGHPAPQIEIGTSIRLGSQPTPVGTMEVRRSDARGGKTLPFEALTDFGRDDPRPAPEWIVGTVSLRAGGVTVPLSDRPFGPGDPLF